MAVDPATSKAYDQMHLVAPAPGAVFTVSLGGDTIVANNNITQIGGAAIALGQTTKSASLPVTLASDQGNVAVSIANVVGNVPCTINAAPTGGATPYQLISAASNNATSLKATAGEINSIQVFNFNTSSARYLKFYNKASAPAPGTDTGLLLKTWAIPAAASSSQPSALFFSGPSVGIAFTTGIAFAIVANLATNDNTSIGANDVLVNIDYN